MVRMTWSTDSYHMEKILKETVFKLPQLGFPIMGSQHCNGQDVILFHNFFHHQAYENLVYL